MRDAHERNVHTGITRIQVNDEQKKTKHLCIWRRRTTQEVGLRKAKADRIESDAIEDRPPFVDDRLSWPVL